MKLRPRKSPVLSDWASHDSLYLNLDVPRLVAKELAKVLVSGNTLSENPELNEVFKTVRGAAADFRATTDQKLAEDTRQPVSDLDKVLIRIADVRDIGQGGLLDFSAATSYWVGSMEAAASRFEQTRDLFRIHEYQYGSNLSAGKIRRRAWLTSLLSGVADGAILAGSLISSGNLPGGIAGGIGLGVAVTSGTVMLGASAGRSLSFIRAAQDDGFKSALHKTVVGACGGTAASLALAMGVLRAGWGGLTSPGSLVIFVVNGIVFTLNASAWASVAKEDPEHERLLKDRETAEQQLKSLPSDAYVALDKILNAALADLDRLVEDINALYEQARKARQFLKLRIPQYLRERGRARAIAEATVARGFNETIAQLEGRALLPEYMQNPPGFERDWAEPSPIALEDYEARFALIEEGISKMQQSVANMKDELRKSHASSIEKIDAAFDGLTRQLRIKTVCAKTLASSGQEEFFFVNAGGQ